MRSLSRRFPVLTSLGIAAGLVGLAQSARAQGDAGAAPPSGRDSLPARAGTYALEGGVGVNSSSVGVLRFLSPRSALGLTLTGGASHASGSTSTSRTTYSSGSVGLSLGYRRYGRLRDRVGAYGTAGLTASYSRYRQSQTGTAQQGTYSSVMRDVSSGVGAFGELGAAYLVVRRLTINASAIANVSLSHARSTNVQQAPDGSVYGNDSRTNGVGASLGPVRLGLTLFL